MGARDATADALSSRLGPERAAVLARGTCRDAMLMAVALAIIALPFAILILAAVLHRIEQGRDLE